MKPDDNKKPFKVLWWNVNLRLDTALKSASPICIYKPHIVFILETSAGYQALPQIEDYRKYADKNIHTLNHGSIAVYNH